jgi:hypothetical protein
MRCKASGIEIIFNSTFLSGLSIICSSANGVFTSSLLENRGFKAEIETQVGYQSKPPKVDATVEYMDSI